MKLEINGLGIREARLSAAGQVARRILALPESMLTRGAAPVLRDGRVLNRRVQALLAFGQMTGRSQLRLDVAHARANLKQLGMMAMPLVTSVHVAERRIPGPAGELKVRVYRRYRGPARSSAIVYLHGGGFVSGDLDTHEGTCRLLADVSGSVVVAVDYRLAPEHPFPAAIEDALAAYGWVHAQADELGIVSGRVGVMGDSAGGSLSAVLCLEARERRLPMPVAQGLIYPCVDLELRFPSYESVGTGFGLERVAMEWFRSQYAPDPADWRSPRVSPIYASDLSSLAPALVVTAGFDPLRDDGARYSEALRAAGVPVRYRCYDDMIHGFFGMGILPEGMAIAGEICAAMGELMAA